MANKKNGLLSEVPLPDTFFSIKHQLRPIAPLRLSVPSAVVIYLLTLGGFVGCWIFYSLPNPPVTTTVIQSEWQKEGYVCKPLQKDSVYGQMWSYDECKKNFRGPSTISLEKYSINQLEGSNIWKYTPFSTIDVEARFIGTEDKDCNWLRSYCSTSLYSCYNAAGGKWPLQTSDAQLATSCFKKLLNDYHVCNVFKENAPFQCTKTEITYKSPLEILSLSIANTQLLFGVLTAFCAYVFYKLMKKNEVLPVGEAGWQEAVEQLKKQVGEIQQALTKKADKTDKETV